MLYTVGSKIDLTELNEKREPKKSVIETSLENAKTLHRVGTRYFFDAKTGAMGIKIPVVYA